MPREARPVDATCLWLKPLYAACVTPLYPQVPHGNGVRTTVRHTLTTVSLPFDHPACPPKTGSEAHRVRGRYVSVERVLEKAQGEEVEWRMATSSDAGGEQRFAAGHQQTMIDQS
jgi:hypothetical protein